MNPVFINGSILRAGLCAYLADRADQELDQLDEREPDCEAEGDKWREPEDPDAWRILAGFEVLKAARCIACHDPGGATPIGPRIPFASPTEFADLVRRTESSGRPLLPAIRRAISANTDPEKRMPFATRDLTVDEQDWLMAYLESMARAN